MGRWTSGPAKAELAGSSMGYAKRKTRKNKKGKRSGCKAKWAKNQFGPLRENRKVFEFSFQKF
jgi:hypothetical protein